MVNDTNIQEFSGIFVKTAFFHINTLSGHFVRMAQGCDTIKDSLNAHLNNSKHSIHETYYGRLSTLHCAIITALATTEHSDGIRLKELANRVYTSDSMPKNPQKALGHAIERLNKKMTAWPHINGLISRANGKARLSTLIPPDNE